jgi:formylglycine-generating enzyme required for sulfatase activity
MVGNLWEFVADWGDLAQGCTNWLATFGSDLSCVGGSGSISFLPGVLLRGGPWSGGVNAGVFAAAISLFPSSADGTVGFRCAR